MRNSNKRDYRELLKKSDKLLQKSARLHEKCRDQSGLVKELFKQSEELILRIRILAGPDFDALPETVKNPPLKPSHKIEPDSEKLPSRKKNRGGVRNKMV